MSWVSELSSQPTYRSLAMLRAVAAGRAEVSWGSEPDLFIDGLPCDYVTAHALAHAGLIRPRWPVLVGHRAPALLTDAGRAMVNGADSRPATSASAAAPTIRTIEAVPRHAHAS